MIIPRPLREWVGLQAYSQMAPWLESPTPARLLLEPQFPGCIPKVAWPLEVQMGSGEGLGLGVYSGLCSTHGHSSTLVFFPVLNNGRP